MQLRLLHCKVKKEPKDHSITKMKLGFGGSQASANSNFSSCSEDVKFLRAMINPNYDNAATLSKTKQEQYMLAKIQSEYKAKIPVLAYTAPTDAVSAVSNYHEWRQCIFKYYTVLSPVLAETTKEFLNGIAYILTNFSMVTVHMLSIQSSMMLITQISSN